MRHHASHSIVCDAPAADVYALIRRVQDWPDIMEPCEAVSILAEDGDAQVIQITARIHGESTTWRSRRRYLPEIFGVDAEIAEPPKLVAAMTTQWRVVALNTQQSLLLLEHFYEVAADVAGLVDGVTTTDEAARFIAAGIDANSGLELADLKRAAERGPSPERRDFHARHSIVCDAPADAVYQLFRDPTAWPKVIDSCTGVTVLETTGDSELVRCGATQDGEHVSWDSRRHYLDDIRRVDYELPVPMPFLESMRGTWRAVPLGPSRTLLTVDRFWRMLPDVTGIRDGVTTVAQAAELVAGFLNSNAGAELLSMRAYAEGRAAPVDVTTTVMVPHPPDAMYGLLQNLAGWPAVLPHCESLELRYDDGRHQEFTMGVDAPDGRFAFRSIRHCDEAALSIIYFQPEPPPAMRTHEGSWQVRAVPGGCEVIARHTAVLSEKATAELGTDDVAEQRQRLWDSLDAHSHMTIGACAAWLARSPAPAPAAAPAPGG